MAQPPPVIPVVLFTYARADHLRRVLDCLRENDVPQLEVFSDGPKSASDALRVAEVRALLRTIDWCAMRVIERPSNLGLGRNVLAGVDEIAARYDAFIVWEDDLIAVPGAYAWLCAALHAYADDSRVMSVTGWTHPDVTPRDVGEDPYFDLRAECWVWGAWARAWRGMNAATATEKMAAAGRRGTAADAYGADLPIMAGQEAARNTWAVRWIYHHLEHGGLTVRPPWSMVEHIGFDAAATNATDGRALANPPLRPAPPIPARWPEPVLNPHCRALWTRAYPGGWLGPWRRLRAAFGLR